MYPKIIVFYLPQFHSIPENDKWWGKGFTEWTRVRTGKPLFKNHDQPKIPLNNNYYNLLDSNTQKWQADLAEKYGIYGFCYYHYWFNGKLLLEKPAEQMLLNEDISIPSCFSWANETWTRTWDGGNQDVLIPQSFNGKEDWEAHILYLLPFFKDKRYIKVNNKPMLLLYTSSRIEQCEEMIDNWNKRLINEGFSGIHIVETLNGWQEKSILKNSEAVVEFEPMYTIRYKLPFLPRLIRFMIHRLSKILPIFLDRLDYEFLCQMIANRDELQKKTTYLGAFGGWDNTARRKKNAIIVTESTPDKFKKHLEIQVSKSLKRNSQYLFINAWNEWGEGAYLEPDTNNKYAYLEKIKEVFETVTRGGRWEQK